MVVGRDEVAEGAVADGLGLAAAAPETVVLHVPEPVLGGNEALGEEGIVLVFGPDVGDAQFVAVYLNLSLEVPQIQGPGEVGDRRLQFGDADFAHTYHAAHLLLFLRAGGLRR